MLFAVVAPVAGIVFLPFFLGQAMGLDVVRIGRHFISLPGAFSGALTFGTPAILLIFDVRICWQTEVTMFAPEGFHGFSIPDVVGRHRLIITGKNYPAP